MAQYIDKAEVKAWLEKRKIPFKKDIDDGVYPTYLCALMDFEEFLDTLEVKEVGEPSKDLEKEFDKCCENYIFDDECEVYTASKFFELGFKAKGE